MGLSTDVPRLRRASSVRAKEEIIDLHNLVPMSVKATHAAVPRAQVYQLPTSSLASNHILPSSATAFEGYAADMIADSLTQDAVLVELGVRSVASTTMLLQAAADCGGCGGYFAVADDAAAVEAFVNDLTSVSPSVVCNGVAGSIADAVELLPTTSRRIYVLSLAHLTPEEARDVLAPFAASYLQPDDVLLCTFPTVLVEPDAVVPVVQELLHPSGPLECHRAALQHAEHKSLFLRAQSLDPDVKDGWYLLDTLLAPSAITELLAPFYHAATYSNATSTTYLVQKPLATLTPPPLVDSGLKHAPSLEDLEKLWRSWDAGSTKAPRSAQAPKLEAWEALWAVWDVVTLEMLPRARLAEMIEHVHAVTAFVVAQLDQGLGDAAAAPVDDVGDVDGMVAFANGVRDRVRATYTANDVAPPLRRVLWMCYEYTALRLEALLSQAVQFEDLLPPPHLVRPRFSVPTEVPVVSFIPIPSGRVVLGHNDNEQVHEHPSIPFGWDNERPARAVELDDSILCEMQSRPVTVSEYAAFLRSAESHDGLLPASWTADGKSVKTVFGPVAVEVAANWPVFVSCDQASAYACHAGLRLPHESELVAMRLPGHGRNVGLTHWAPTPVASNAHGWVAENAWEWTCDTLAPHDGFIPSALHPSHTTDFFDGQHNVLVGASWATPASMADRRTLRTWHHRSSGLAFATFRCVKTTVPLS
ncbi:hypothetical protein ACHHYP_04867 [Achlya hypogyna]|uniref:Sulfatase-modifying factor enzyme domain-containing protein n=1 Tax=Achlya hypogyna TaxID=1202772 RepID=A0A1V9YZV8_ACHHY|nr:hypothetical protein ACHHYP_04867 [Achlya hypogyna]